MLRRHFYTPPVLAFLEPYPMEYDFYISKDAMFADEATLDFPDSIEELIARIDTIDADLVAKLKIESLYATAQRSYWCTKFLKKGLCLVLPDNNKHKSNPEMNDEKTRLEDAAKKNILDRNDPTKIRLPSMRPIVAKAIEHLAKVSKLYHPWHTKPTCSVGAFFVPKSKDKLRMIVDGRFANIRWNKSYGKFSFFSLETLKQVIDNLSTRKWFALNLDLRHWFHQIPLPTRYKEYFGLKVAGDGWFVPQAVPMGWLLAPFIAQSITWAILLAREKGMEDVFDIDIETLKNLTELPTWIPLKSGGGIFVVIDNILVITPREETAKAWMEHILAAAKQYSARLKCEKSEDSDETDESLLWKQCYVEMSDSTSTSFEFMGVRWFYSKHVAEVDEKDRGSLPHVVNNKWIGSRKALASVLGKLIWHRRVHAIYFYEHQKESSALRSIYSHISPGEGISWNSSIELSVDELQGLSAAWARRGSQGVCLARPLSQKPSDIIWAAVDAATNENSDMKEPMTAAVIFNKGNNNHTIHRKSFRRDQHIALGELLAIKLVLEKIQGFNVLVILATDSLTAKRWVEGRNAHNEEALLILKEIFSIMDEKQIRLYCIYVPTKLNVSDRPSREIDDHLDLKCLDATRRLLILAESEALGMWMKDGPRSGGVIRERGDMTMEFLE